MTDNEKKKKENKIVIGYSDEGNELTVTEKEFERFMENYRPKPLWDNTGVVFEIKDRIDIDPPMKPAPPKKRNIFEKLILRVTSWLRKRRGCND